MNNDAVLQTHDLTKQYESVLAVDHLNLTVYRGEVFGLLGPNGAGKTTTILMLLGLTEPTAGTVQVLGFDPVRQPLSVKARVGYLPERLGFYENLTARENLIYTAMLNGIERKEADRRIEEALERVGLADVADRRVSTFSRGMRQRLGVADVLIKRPELIIMDEPTQGLDPEAARSFLQLIQELKGEGITILLSSHLLHQVQAVCDRVGLFHKGRMALEGSVEDLARRILGSAYRIRLEAEGPVETLEAVLRKLDGVNSVGYKADQRRFELVTTADIRPQVARAVVEAGGALYTLEIETMSLDEIYTHYFEEEVSHGTD